MPLIMLNCNFIMFDKTRDFQFLVLINSNALFSFISSSVPKHLGWVAKPKNTPVAVKLANGTVVHSSGATNGLILSGI